MAKAKKSSKSRNLSLYSNLVHNRRTKKDAAARKRAEYLASLPKHPVKRLLYRLHPKRFWSYWFSKRGLFTLLKIAGVAVLLVVIAIGGVFAYYRKDIDSLNPGELAANVQTTVTKYYARDAKTLLWEDKGQDNYTLTVPGDKINKYMKEATVAIEDRDFYKHGGFSVTGIARATFNNFSGGSTQGGSTLTQQLVKQVFFSDQSSDRGISGIPRKIKELILSVEVERRYDKDTILDLYLNESPYGGRRNGVESGAETYFHTTAEKLTLPQAALLAAIPQNPSRYDPTKLNAKDSGLIARQHQVLDNMADQGYITKSEAEAAKKVDILSTVHNDVPGDSNIKAPWFVFMVRDQLEKQLGKAAVGKGGYTVITTLDADVQNKLEEQMAAMFASSTPDSAGFTNGAATVEDVKTGQVIALMGSRDWNYPGYGQDNAAMAFIQPGSSIKPLVYAQLFQQHENIPNVYGSGTILPDTKTNFGGGYSPNNADKAFLGNISIRQSLARSRNIPALKAMQLNEQDSPGSTWKTIRDMGDTYYCTQGPDQDAGLASAIGGCGTRQVDHVNAMASLGRLGVYKPWSLILEAKDSSGQVQIKYKDESKQVVDPQAAYIVNDILGDEPLRKYLATTTPALDAAGVRVSLKTGTSDKDGQAKDIWSVLYTPNLSIGVWLGNSDTSTLKLGYSYIPVKIADPVLAYASQLYEQQGKGKTSDWFAAPAGIQNIRGELYPSYYNKSQASSTTKMTFDRISKKKATDCTPASTKVDVDVTKAIDPYTKKEIVSAADGYDATKDDDVHQCGDVQPSFVGNSMTWHKTSGSTYSFSATVQHGRYSLTQLIFTVNGGAIKTIDVSSNGGNYSANYTFATPGTYQVAATVTDEAGYTTTTPSQTITVTSAGSGG